MVIPALKQIEWQSTYRVIRSIYPPVDLFEDIADAADWELVMSAEAKTNPRVRDEIGSIHLVPPERRVSGPGATLIMAAFCHISAHRPSRFSNGAYGVYYAGDSFEVALRETIYHFEQFMRATDEPPAHADYRELVGAINANLHDLRGNPEFESALDPHDYTASQLLAQNLRNAENSDGFIYPSVRHPAGEAIAIFWPDVVSIPMQGRHLRYWWNGSRADAYRIYGDDNWIAL